MYFNMSREIESWCQHVRGSKDHVKFSRAEVPFLKIK